MGKAVIALFGLALLQAVSGDASIIVYRADLSGANESPPVASLGTGVAEVTYDSVSHMLTVEVSFQDLVGNTTASHIHCCTAAPFAGTVGVATQVPTFAGFPLGVTAGMYMSTFDLTVAGSWNPAFVTAHGGTLASAEADLLAGLAGGNGYLNIHTSFSPGGEIRGFLRPAPEPATLGWMLAGLGALAVTRRKRRT